MSNPIATTFRTLAAAANDHTLAVLIHALDVPNENIQTQAVTALLSSRNPSGHVEVIRRLEKLSSEQREQLNQYSGLMGKAIRQCLRSDDRKMQRNAAELVRDFDVYDLLPALLNLLMDVEQDEEYQRLWLETIHALANSLYEHAKHTQVEKRYLRDAERIRLQMVTALEQACADRDFPGHDQLIEDLLILGDLSTNEIRKLFGAEDHPSRSLAEQIVLTSDHPGIMQIVVEMMDLGYPDSLAFCCIAERNDPEFVCHLLRSWPHHLTVSQRKNYQAIHSVCWLNVKPLSLDFIPAELHMKLLHFVVATGVKRDAKSRAAEWVVGHGRGEARRLATEMIDDADQSRMRSMISTGLESENEGMQAWATSQLRAKNAPEAFTELIERLDSPMAQVQQVAREELGDFDLRRILDLFEQLDPRICKMAGELIQKIDPETREKLIAEMTGPMRSKRIRAIKASVALGMHGNVVETLIELLDDSDALVRRTVLDILVEIPGVETYLALVKMLDDPNTRIREIAKDGLRHRETPEGIPGAPVT